MSYSSGFEKYVSVMHGMLCSWHDCSKSFNLSRDIVVRSVTIPCDPFVAFATWSYYSLLERLTGEEMCMKIAQAHEIAITSYLEGNPDRFGLLITDATVRNFLQSGKHAGESHVTTDTFPLYGEIFKAHELTLKPDESVACFSHGHPSHSRWIPSVLATGNRASDKLMRLFLSKYLELVQITGEKVSSVSFGAYCYALAMDPLASVGAGALYAPSRDTKSLAQRATQYSMQTSKSSTKGINISLWHTLLSTYKVLATTSREDIVLWCPVNTLAFVLSDGPTNSGDKQQVAQIVPSARIVPQQAHTGTGGVREDQKILSFVVLLKSVMPAWEAFSRELELDEKLFYGEPLDAQICFSVWFLYRKCFGMEIKATFSVIVDAHRHAICSAHEIAPYVGLPDPYRAMMSATKERMSHESNVTASVYDSIYARQALAPFSGVRNVPKQRWSPRAPEAITTAFCKTYLRVLPLLPPHDPTFGMASLLFFLVENSQASVTADYAIHTNNLVALTNHIATHGERLVEGNVLLLSYALTPSAGELVDRRLLRAVKSNDESSEKTRPVVANSSLPQSPTKSPTTEANPTSPRPNNFYSGVRDMLRAIVSLQETYDAENQNRDRVVRGTSSPADSWHKMSRELYAQLVKMEEFLRENPTSNPNCMSYAQFELLEAKIRR